MRNPVNNTNQRFVLYISDKLRNQIEAWIKKHDITLADFGRAALLTHLNNKKREANRKQLAETCRLFDNNHNHRR